ncbi:MAG: nucleotidyl transferase AbiEii/AbiGii toxin family protein [Coprobacillus sp.]|nr:nucleotidyl transferase AbiEii/AbiGii toxin family protein [Coprobacillus sp.]
MYLHEDKELFTSFIQVTASTYHLDEAFVEKDYYVCLLLDKLRKKIPTLLFKGGTSLVKCYHIINRFSEDIDISLAQEKISERPRKRVKEAIKEACLELGLVITNLNNTEKGMTLAVTRVTY